MERLCSQQGHISIADQYQVSTPLQDGSGLYRSMTGSPAFLLVDKANLFCVQRLAQLLAVPAYYKHRFLRADLERGVKYIAGDWLACQRVQQLGQTRLEPGAFTGCQNDRCQVHVCSFE
jgi:hypothetical protein